MDSKRLVAFRDELYKIHGKSEKKNNENEVHLDELVATHVGLSLFNHTAALGQLTPIWTLDVQLESQQKSIYATLSTEKWEAASSSLEDLFVGRLCYRFMTEDGAINCDTKLDDNDRYSNSTDDKSSLLFWLADEAHRRIRTIPHLGKCAAILYPLCAVLPAALPQRVRGVCHSVFCHGNNITMVDFHCRRFALPATSDLLRLSLYKALSLRVGLATPEHLRVATLIAYLDQERPRLRFWTYILSKQMDEAVMSLDCLAQVIKLLQLHVTEVIT